LSAGLIVVASVGVGQINPDSRSDPTTRSAQSGASDPRAATTAGDFDRLLGPSRGEAAPLRPESTPAIDAASGVSVAPGARSVPLRREGSYLVDRIGRLSREGSQSPWQFAFESDGAALADPPVVVLPNLKLMLMEDQLEAAQSDLRFRITGMLTEYRNRNHVLIEKVVVLAEEPRPF
jgi:hypothetical protein